eukprot:scaffold635_cov53-Phaeocystis_antarctica.AAC.1
MQCAERPIIGRDVGPQGPVFRAESTAPGAPWPQIDGFAFCISIIMSNACLVLKLRKRPHRRPADAEACMHPVGMYRGCQRSEGIGV